MQRFNRAARFWKLVGSIGDTVIRWSSAPLARETILPDEMLTEPRIIEGPGEFLSAGMTQEPGAAPEGSQVQLVVSNADGALTPYLLGSARTALEYRGPSFLGLRASLYLGRVTSSGYSERPVTPPMVVSNAVEIDAHRVRLTLTADTSGLAIPMPVFAAGDLAGAQLTGVDLSPGAAAWCSARKISSVDLWNFAQAAMLQSHSVTVPTFFGPTPVRLTAVGDSDAVPAFYLVGVDGMGAGPSGLGRYREGFERRDFGVIPTSRILQDYLPFAVTLSLATPEGARSLYLVICMSQQDPIDAWVVPSYAGVDSGRGGPVDLLRHILEWAGGIDLDASAWDKAAELQEEWVETVAGLVRSTAPASSLMQHLGALGDLRYYIAPLRGLGVALGSVSYEEIAQAKSADLPHIEALDILPDGARAPRIKQVIPAGPDDANAAMARVSIDWPEEIRELYPLETTNDRHLSSNANASPLAELVVSGEWIRPARASSVVPLLVDRHRYPARMVEITSHIDAAAIAIGSLVRVSSELGLTAEGGPWVRRLCRLERITILGADMACRLLLRDLGPLEAMRQGKLDSLANWVLVESPPAATLTPGSGRMATLTTGPLPGDAADYVLAAAWIFGAVRRSWAIRAVTPGTQWTLTLEADEDHGLPPPPMPLARGDWGIMRTHMQAGAGFRPDYIRGAEAEGFDDGEPPYVYSRL